MMSRLVIVPDDHYRMTVTTEAPALSPGKRVGGVTLLS